MVQKLIVPETMQRNHSDVARAGYENTGQMLMELAARHIGLPDLANADILDVGCGVRFVQTIQNRDIAVKSYTGLEVNREIVDFLKQQVEARDPRFKFVHWDVHNALYNADGHPLAEHETLPVDGSFDVIWMFSVVTHLNPVDTAALLALLRKKVRPGGSLFFSTFIDDGIEGFDDRVDGSPLLMAYYGRKTMETLVDEAGWEIRSFHDADWSNNFIQHHLVCTPKAT